MPIAANLYYYAFQGGGPDTTPVVLIHGAGGSHLSWPPELRRLSGYNLFALDLPGHGKSPGPGHQSISAYAEQVVAWMDALEVHRAVFGGHSMGGAVALTLAAQRPAAARALILVGTGPRLSVNRSVLEHSANPATFPQAVNALIASSFSREADERLVELVSRRMAETRASVLHGDLLASARFDASEWLPGIRCPTLVVCGAEDRICPRRQAQFLAAQIPRASLRLIPHAGHMVMLEQTQAVTACSWDFLEGLSW